VVTPNLHEAELLTGKRVRTLREMERAALEIFRMGPRVVIKGGHLKRESSDVLFDGKDLTVFPGRKTCRLPLMGQDVSFQALWPRSWPWERT